MSRIVLVGIHIDSCVTTNISYEDTFTVKLIIVFISLQQFSCQTCFDLFDVMCFRY